MTHDWGRPYQIGVPPSCCRIRQHWDNFLLCHHFSQEKLNQNSIDIHHSTPSAHAPPPAHLLHELRNCVLRKFDRGQQNQIENSKTTSTSTSINELKAAGIRVKRSMSKCPIHITFSSCLFSGELELPEIVVDDTTAPTYLNLIAYEVCPDFENNYEISSYVEFLDSLIDHPDDVKELRAAGVLHNGLGSDEKVANLFNIISTDSVPNTAIYGVARAEIEKHYKQKHKTWFALAYYNYFSNPWAIIALIAASVALLLTYIQTWYAVFPSISK